MNRRLVTYLVLIAVLLPLLAACGGDDDDDDEAAATNTSTEVAATATQAPSDDTPTATEESGSSGESREIEHEMGTTTLSGVPERIVVLEYSFADNLGTLGVVPVGFAVDAPPEYLAEYTEDAGSEAVGTRAEPDLEAIAGLAPDLIIADLFRHEEIYDLLSEIAPTLVFNSLRGTYQDQLDTFSVLAGVLDHEEEADELLNSYQATFDDATAQTNTDAGEFMIGVLHAEGFTAHSNESFMGSFLEGLGRTNALEPDGGDTQYLLSLEGIASVDPAAIVVLCNPADQQVLDDLTSEPVWQLLEAATNDRVYVFDRNLWSKGRGLLAYEQILADAVDSGLLSDEPSTRTTCG